MLILVKSNSNEVQVKFKYSNKLICHIMQDKIKEVDQVRTRLYSQEFTWKKRMWAISKDAVAWIDRKGISHMFFDVNESDGTIRWLAPYKQNIIDDKCTECGGKISIDAKNAWDMLKRKTINTFWGIDSSHIVLLIIMGIVAMSAVAGVMYLVGQNTKLQEQLNKYLVPVPTTNPNIPVVPKLIIGVLI